MSGFQEDFLGENFIVKLPIHKSETHQLIKYLHFSVYFNSNRRLALFSASNNRRFAPKIKRRKFRKDKKNLLPSVQLGQEFYGSKTIDKSPIDDSNVFDRGHITAKHYVDWGENVEEAKKASDDSFFYTNATPQYWEINQPSGVWNKIETFVMDNLGGKDVSVISGQIFRQDDPTAVYINSRTNKEDEIKIPLKFWKVVYYVHNKSLKRIAFVIKQDKEVCKLPFIKSSDVKFLEILRADPFDALPKSLKTYIVNPTLIEDATNIKFFKAEDYFSIRNKDFAIKESPRMAPEFIELSEVDLLNYL